jgi:hypothetical protein
VVGEAEGAIVLFVLWIGSMNLWQRGDHWVSVTMIECDWFPHRRLSAAITYIFYSTFL